MPKIKHLVPVSSGTKLSFKSSSYTRWFAEEAAAPSFRGATDSCRPREGALRMTHWPQGAQHVSEIWKEFGVPERCVVEAVPEGHGTPALLFRYQGDPVFILHPEKVDLLKQRLAEAGDVRQLERLDRIMRNAHRSTQRSRRQFSIGEGKPDGPNRPK